ncbi:hypothetical protein SARC_05662 [Sphaeroforma arctica JP610]|uniref:Suppressor of forked domain-containing protein n=1 Tax=Sphaeroforma arctica JP610 TaxID=667725 RepID=A0A0L0FYZ2_9EUKA|nr:hypothetical protein SARC_05662 [Sphaeroforma arctica JP610]KNC82045.1 hypothetical protein SARC_05662 [Sphaeroforma arctica JP610]|eukprot:XP_014155947.1 hypothetical protein SARC_05662 [Sphaeroforma arctica JP610]
MVAFGKFLSYFPLCFGYWKKYADLEHKLAGIAGVTSVYEQGVAAIPQSVDLWVHYLKHAQAQEDEQVPGQDNGQELLKLFERAAQACGRDWKSSPFWDLYLAQAQQSRDKTVVAKVYAQLLAIPHLYHDQYVAKFNAFVADTAVETIATPEEIDAIKQEIEASMGQMSEIALAEEVKSKAAELRQKVAMATSVEANRCKPFEDRLARNYFHVKDVDEQQKTAWKTYLCMMIDASYDREVIAFTFERCLIVCALYEEFWLQFAYWHRGDPQAMAAVLQRAILFTANKPNCYLALASAQEAIGADGIEGARATYKMATETFTTDSEGFVELAVRYSNFERRQNEAQSAVAVLDAAVALCEAGTATHSYLLGAKAELQSKVGEAADARATYEACARANPSNKDTYLRWLNWEQSFYTEADEDVSVRTESVFAVVKEVGTAALAEQDLADLALRRVRLLDTLGSDAALLQSARLDYFGTYGSGATFNPATAAKKRHAQDAMAQPVPKAAKVDAQVPVVGVVAPAAHVDPMAQHNAWAQQQNQWGNYQQQGYGMQQGWGNQQYGWGQ